MSIYAVQFHHGSELEVELYPEGHGWEARVEGQSYNLRLLGVCKKRGLTIEIDGERVYLPWDADMPGSLQSVISNISIEIPSVRDKATSQTKANIAAEMMWLPSPMSGIILEILVEAGQHVQKGQPLMVVEAMKMENLIYAPCSAIISRYAQLPGSSVRKGDHLVEILPQHNGDYVTPSQVTLGALSIAPVNCGAIN